MVPPAPPRRPPWFATALVVLWLAGVVWGFRYAWTYEAAAGAPATPATDWPRAAPFAPDGERYTLVLAAHPHCPCTRATLGELEKIVAHCGERLSVHLLFYSDPELGPGWERSDLWQQAARIPGARVVADPLGRTASEFGARTSGQVFLYAPERRLVFRGGITLSRGHAGDNAGATAVVQWVTSGRSDVTSTPVFGCALSEQEPDSRTP